MARVFITGSADGPGKMAAVDTLVDVACGLVKGDLRK